MAKFIDDVSMLDGVDLGELDQPSADEPYEPARGGGGSGTPKAGRFNLQLPAEIKVGLWEATPDKPASIELNLDPLVVVAPGDAADGTTIRFVRVSTRRIGGANASSATDLLQRAGYTGGIPRDLGEWQNAAQTIAGQVIEGVYCDWECVLSKKVAPTDADVEAIRTFLKDEAKLQVTDRRARRVVIRGMKQFPSDGNGGFKSKISFENGPGGKPLTLYANLKPTLRGFGLTAEEQANR